MQITKEIYEVLSQTSRFLKYNDAEKVWEEVRIYIYIYIYIVLFGVL